MICDFYSKNSFPFHEKTNTLDVRHQMETIRKDGMFWIIDKILLLDMSGSTGHLHQE